MSSIIKVDTVQDIDGNNIINENANTITIGASGDTITIPSGATLANNGTATGFASIAWQSVQTTGFTAVAGEGYPCNTTSAAFTVTLPSSASVGDQVQIVDYAGTFATNNITLTSSLNIEGGADDKALTTNREGVTITYVDATQGWVATSGVNSGDQALDPVPYSIDFLVVAGGGGGGKHTGGGGGAGGYRTSTQTPNGGAVITVTVGDGGAGGVSPSTVGSSGSNSSISGSGLMTITSAGGGGGAGFDGSSYVSATSGGSGGGGTSTSGAEGTGASGNTPSTSPVQGYVGGNGDGAPYYGGGGGGGSAAVGVNMNSSAPGTGGNGGAGTASSITGSSVTRAGGGGGGINSSISVAGTGGAGGGGDGSASGNGVAGTVNTGSGGGGGYGSTPSNDGGAGGKGVVILSLPDANYSGTTTGSPTVATGVSGKTVLTFTGDGSYTA
jgi:hypothetical protein